MGCRRSSASGEHGRSPSTLCWAAFSHPALPSRETLLGTPDLIVSFDALCQFRYRSSPPGYGPLRRGAKQELTAFFGRPWGVNPAWRSSSGWIHTGQLRLPLRLFLRSRARIDQIAVLSKPQQKQGQTELSRSCGADRIPGPPLSPPNQGLAGDCGVDERDYVQGLVNLIATSPASGGNVRTFPLPPNLLLSLRCLLVLGAR